MQRLYRSHRGFRPRAVGEAEKAEAQSGRMFQCVGYRFHSLICSCCDRDQIYCAGDCSQKARRSCHLSGLVAADVNPHFFGDGWRQITGTILGRPNHVLCSSVELCCTAAFRVYIRVQATALARWKLLRQLRSWDIGPALRASRPQVIDRKCPKDQCHGYDHQ